MAVLLLLLPAAACGADDPGAGGPSGLDAIEVGGETGSAPEVAFAEDMTAGEQQTETVVTGDGASLESGDRVIVNYWLGNGYSQEPVQGSFGPANVGVLATVGEEPQPPQTLDDVIAAAASTAIEEGTTVGSRVVITGSPEEVLGVPGLPELGIGNLDPVVLVIDLVQEPLSAPGGQAVEPPAWVPEIETADGAPAAFRFAGTSRPSGALRSFARIVGDGPEVAEGDLVVADYLGQVYGADEPFDDSYGEEADPIGFGLGRGTVIEGWDRALVGETVGSRVVLAIPPRLGYGEQGNPQIGIESDDTLYFLVDILGAA